MYNVTINIAITQTPSDQYPKRNRALLIDGCESYFWTSSWEQMTDTGTITLPRNIVVSDDKGQPQPLYGSNVSVGGFSGDPLFMRGDRVTLSSGYTYFKYDGTQVTEVSEIINGFISKVGTNVPLELSIEDNMWLLKQTPVANKTFSETQTLEDILQYLIDQVNKLHGVRLTFKSVGKTEFGQQFILRNETAAQVLNRLHNLFGFVPYFVGDVLSCGTIIQYPNEAGNHYFILDGEKSNVPAQGSELEYQRLDDVVLSAIAHNTLTEETGSTTKDGQPKTKRTRLEVLVTLKGGKVESKVIGQGERAPENDEGERRSFFFPWAKTTDELITATKEKLTQYAYTGLKGSFQCYGIPYVKHGDNANINSDKFPEQNGIYRVKAVKYSYGGDIGLKQQVELYYKLLQ